MIRFLFGAAIVLSAPATAARFKVHEIAPLAGYTVSTAYRLNDTGMVAGISYNDGSEETAAFLWTRQGGTVALFPGGGSSAAHSISNNGQIAGIIDNHAFVRRSDGSIEMLRETSSRDDASLGYMVNDEGQIGGSVTVRGQTYAAIWETAGARPNIIGAPPYSIISGGGEGYWVGTMRDFPGTADPYFGGQGFVWSDTTGLIDIPAFAAYQSCSFCTPYKQSNARDARADGVVVGYATDVDGIHALWWTNDTGIHDMGDLVGGRVFSRARAINSAGQVIGFGDAGSGYRATLWDSLTGPIQDLNDLIDPTLGWTLEQANDINERGEILGIGYNAAGQYVAFLLTPNAVPEPTTWAMMIAGFGLVGAAARRRVTTVTRA
jgi:uncharacterized membrane protein